MDRRIFFRLPVHAFPGKEGVSRMFSLSSKYRLEMMMTRSLLIAAMMALTLTACSKKEALPTPSTGAADAAANDAKAAADKAVEAAGHAVDASKDAAKHAAAVVEGAAKGAVDGAKDAMKK
ncbi:hypothetical protein [Sulfuriferula plumbiphila]|nr:hypothetical protein [Sulfuriferula plumbiphila]